MWTKNWTMKEGFAIGAGLMAAGLMLQLTAGPVAWGTLRWPANGIAMAVFLSIVTAVFMLRRRVYAFQFVGTLQAAVPALVYAVALTIVMGLTRQDTTPPTAAEWATGTQSPISNFQFSTSLSHMLSFWPFVLVYVYIALILGTVTLRRITMLACGVRLRHVTFVLSHLGLFLAMTTATLGNADVQRLKMICVKGAPEWRAMDSRHTIVEMPFSIELKQFIMETYDDGSPKRFASEIEIQSEGGKRTQATVDVNKPAEADGWKIYQYGYDTQMGPMSSFSTLELVSDPWLPLVYTGIYMLLAGAAGMFLQGGRKRD